jgi:starch synthase
MTTAAPPAKRPRRTADSGPLTVLMVASEVTPYAKTGGLGDVTGSLPQALERLGHRVVLVVPRYRGITAGTRVSSATVQMGGLPHEVAFFTVSVPERATLVLVDCPELFDRDGIYGTGTKDFPDNARRFGLLARAALEYAAASDLRPSVVHAHDWQAGLVPVYLRTRYDGHDTLGGVPAVFTIHNLAYQGLFEAGWMHALDLGWDLFTPERLEYWGRMSFLKGGINFSEIITTVSRRYARESLTPEFGFGFEGILQRRARGRRGDLVGILNGIDTGLWNPERDPFVPWGFSADRLEGKRAAKRALLGEMGLVDLPEMMNRPVVGLISRMVDQKGFDLLASAGDELARLDATFVLLGSGEPRYEQLWRSLADRHPARIAVRIGFDERLAHLIEAGADMFLMPSRFEPCGLNQMYSLRYGTVPVVRATGGLDDTVTNYSDRRRTGTGFKFRDPSVRDLLAALRRAIRTYGRRADWQRIQRAGMALDHSWNASAREYVKVYRRAGLAARRRAPSLALAR